MINKIKHGFTLTEVLITLVIIAIISLILMSLVQNALPNEDILLVKKSLQTAQSVVQQLTNDARIYPDGTFINFPGDVQASEQNAYFCNQFEDKINTKGASNCAGSTINSPIVAYVNGSEFDSKCANINANSTVAFETTDGIKWYGLAGAFTNHEVDGHEQDYKVICVKVSDEARAIGIGIRDDGKIIPGQILNSCLDADPTVNDSSECSSSLYPSND